MERARGQRGRTRRGRAGRGCALVAGLFAVHLFPGAAIGADWVLPGQVLDAGGQGSAGPRVGVAADGATTTVWVREDGAGHDRVEAMRTAADGSIAVSRGLSPAGSDATDPRVVVAADGRATVTWERPVAGDNLVEMVRLGAAGQPTGPAVALSQPGEDAFDHVLTGLPDGTAMAGWYRFDGVNDRVQVRRIRAGGDLGAVTTVSPVNFNGYDPAIALGADGSAVIAWARESGGGGTYSVQAQRRDASDILVTLPAIQLSAGGVDASQVHAARSPTGAGLIAWVGNDGVETRVQAAPIAPDGGLGAERDLSQPATFFIPRLAVAPSGDSTVVWTQDFGGVDRIFARRVEADGTPGAFQSMSSALGDNSQVEIAVGPGGATTLVWRLNVAGTTRVEGRRWDPDGTLGPLERLSAPGPSAAQPHVAAAPDGSAAVAWHRDGFPGAIEGTDFDATAPVVSAVAPPAAIAGVPATLTARATDRSALTYAWDFGDGTAGAGDTSAHTYAAPGTYIATVTATDAAGNAAAAAVQVPVAAAPVPPAADTRAPVLTGLSVTPRRVVRGRLVRQTRRITLIRFRLDEAARARIVVQRRVAGRRSAAACVRPTRALIRAKARRCARFAGVGTITRNARPGPTTVRIVRLRVGRRILTPGRHRIVVRAVDAAGNRSAVRARPLIVVAHPSLRR